MTQDFAPDLGGMARLHVELCRRLASDGLLVSTVSAPEEADRGEPYGVHRQPFAFDRVNRLPNVVRWTRWLSGEVKPGDIVHAGNLRPVGYSAWWVSKTRHIPYVLHVYGGDLLREKRKISDSVLKRATARAIFGNARGIIGCSKWTAELALSVARDAGVAHPPPVAGIDLGTDPSRFQPSRDSGALRRRFALGDDPLLLTVARLVPHKGQDVALQAIALIARDVPRLRYLLVGAGEDDARLRALAAELGIQDRVVFAGALADDELPEAYATSTLYVGPSRVDAGVNVEGFGISFIEAGASGVPAVAGDSGGVRSAVRDGLTGIVVPPGDAKAVASALRTLLRDHDRRRAMGKEARRLVESYYNWDRVAAETRAFVLNVTRTATRAA